MAEGFLGTAVADTLTWSIVADGLARAVVADTSGRLVSGVGVKETVEDAPFVIVTWLVSSDSVGPMVVVREGLLAAFSPDIIKGVVVLVKVAFEAKGVKVEVPSATRFTILIPELQAADDPVKRMNMIRIAINRLGIMGYFSHRGT